MTAKKPLESKVGLLDAVQALNSIDSVDKLSAPSIKILFGLCGKEDLNSKHDFEKMAFEKSCFLQVASLSNKFIDKLRNEHASPGLHVIVEVRNKLLQKMETTYEDTTLPEDQRAMALRVVGNLGHSSSLSLLRQILVPTELDHLAKHDDAENLVHKIIALDALRNIDDQEAKFEEAQLVLEVLNPKASLALHAAAVVAFFDASPTSSQLNTFWTSVERHNLLNITSVAFELKLRQRIASNQQFEMLLRFCTLPTLASTCSKISQIVAVNNAEKQSTFSRVNSLHLLGLDQSPADFQAILYNSAGIQHGDMDLFDFVFHLTGQQFKHQDKIEELEQREFRRIANRSTLQVIEVLNGLNSIHFAHLSTGERTLIGDSNTTNQGRLVRSNGYDLLIPVQLVRDPSLIKDVDRVKDNAVVWPQYTPLLSAKFLGATVCGISSSTILGIFPKSAYHVPKPILANEELTINPASISVRPSYYIGSKQNFKLSSSFLNMTFGVVRTSKINPKHVDQNAPYSISIEQGPILTINNEPVEVPSDQTPSNQRLFNGTLFDLDAQWRWLPKSPFEQKSFGNNVLNLVIAEQNISLRNSSVSHNLQIASPIFNLHEIEANLLEMNTIVDSIKNGHFDDKTEKIQHRCERDANSRDCTAVAGETGKCTQCKRLVKMVKESVAAIKAPITTVNEALCAQTTVTADCGVCKAATNIFYDGLLDILSSVSIEDFICKFVVTECSSADELKMKKANRIPCSICEKTANSLFDGVLNYQSLVQNNYLTLCPTDKTAKETCSTGISGLIQMFSGGTIYAKSQVAGTCLTEFNCAKDATELNDKLDIKKGS